MANENPSYNPGDATTQDKLSPLTLSRPTGFPRGQNLYTVAINLLTFQVQRQNSELVIDLRAVALRDASTRRGIGTQPYRTGGFTIEQRFSVFPKN